MGTPNLYNRMVAATIPASFHQVNENVIISHLNRL